MGVRVLPGLLAFLPVAALRLLMPPARSPAVVPLIVRRPLLRPCPVPRTHGKRSKMVGGAWRRRCRKSTAARKCCLCRGGSCNDARKVLVSFCVQGQGWGLRSRMGSRLRGTRKLAQTLRSFAAATIEPFCQDMAPSRRKSFRVAAVVFDF